MRGFVFNSASYIAVSVLLLLELVDDCVLVFL